MDLLGTYLLLRLHTPVQLMVINYSYRAALGYNYDYSFTSHSHGWSTGPTSALAFYVVGLQIVEPQGLSWTLSPHFGGLTAAEGGFTTPLGWFGASWEIKDSRVTVNISTPLGTRGTVNIPGNATDFRVDGKALQASGANFELSGGNHTIVGSI